MKGWKLALVRIAALVFVVALTVVLILNRNQVRKLEGYGYPGIFLVSIMANATIILPLPGVLITSAMGAVFNPFWVAVAAGSGASLGELSGYLAGFGGQGMAEKAPIYATLERWIKRYGGFAVFVLALVPNPLFDVGGMIAGALGMPVYQFLIFCWLGKVLKMLAFAYGGSIGINLLPWFNN